MKTAGQVCDNAIASWSLVLAKLFMLDKWLSFLVNIFSIREFVAIPYGVDVFPTFDKTERKVLEMIVDDEIM